jgi:hypothetical protein
MLLRYKQRKKQKVSNFGESTSDMRVVGFGYGPWRWYRGVTEVWGIEEKTRKGEGR